MGGSGWGVSVRGAREGRGARSWRNTQPPAGCTGTNTCRPATKLIARHQHSPGGAGSPPPAGPPAPRRCRACSCAPPAGGMRGEAPLSVNAQRARRGADTAGIRTCKAATASAPRSPQAAQPQTALHSSHLQHAAVARVELPLAAQQAGHEEVKQAPHLLHVCGWGPGGGRDGQE